MKKPILVDLIFFSLFLKQFRLGASTVSWSTLFHLSMTRFEKMCLPCLALCCGCGLCAFLAKMLIDLLNRRCKLYTERQQNDGYI